MKYNNNHESNSSRQPEAVSAQVLAWCYPKPLARSPWRATTKGLGRGAMQAFGRLRYERCLRQRGRTETQLELRLEQAIADAEASAKADAEAERKKIALRCQKAIEADALCQAAERRRATRGTEEASKEEHRQVVQRIFEICEAAKQQD